LPHRHCRRHGRQPRMRQKEEAPAPIAGTPAATSAPVQGAPGANAGISYESRMPSNVKNSMQTKGAPIK
ncbi:MAG: hypothetical protein ACOVT5_01360, partial [Armatimonadaceae bacterium]